MSDMLDLFVIGAGSGGVRAGRIAAKAGAKVAVAEEYRTGGTCVIRGCVPKKLLVYASEYSRDFKHAEGFGWTVGEPQFEWAKLRDAVAAEVTRLEGIYAKNLQAAGAELHLERAVIAGPNTVRLEKSGREIKTKRILIATGGRPSMPTETPGWELAMSSNECFTLEKLPKSILIAGGGYIAVEFACIFLGLGVDTTLIYRGEQILRGFDEDVRAHVTKEMQRRGLKIITGRTIKDIKAEGETKIVELSDRNVMEVDQVLFAIGRKPNTEGLGLEAAGVKRDDEGAIAVDEFSKTNVEGIWAVGDVTNRINLTPVAIREGHAFADTEFNNKPTSFDHDTVPAAVFCQPSVSVVGLTEAQAEARYKIDVYQTDFRPMKNILAKDDERMFMKLVVRCSDDVVVGCHVVGPDAAEIVQMAAIAVKASLTKKQWDDTCALHPTVAEELVTLRDKFVG